MVVAKVPSRVDSKMYNAALAYYGLPREYNRTFKLVELYDKEAKTKRLDKNGDPLTTMAPCRHAVVESRDGNAVWVQVNRPRKDAAFDEHGRPKKATNDDIEIIHNVTLDFEYPQEPSIAHQIGLDLAFYLEEQGMAAEGLPVEDSGAGCHIVLPIEPIKATPETAKRWNEAIRAVVKKYIEPEFERLAELYGIQIRLDGYDISRIFSVPGTWRPHNPKKNDCDALKNGYLRHWLPPYNEPGNYPTRRENQRLAALIREAFEALQAPAKPVQDIPKPTPASPSPDTPSQWLAGYANKHVTNDRSASFQALINGLWLNYGDERLIWGLKEQVNDLSGGKYNGRLDNELERSIELAKQLPREERPKHKQTKDQEPKLSKHSANAASNGSGNTGGAGKNPTTFDLCSFSADDAGNGDALYALYGKEFLWCSSRGWFHYVGTHWELDPDGAEVKKRAVVTLRKRRHAAVDAENEPVIKCTKADESRVNGCVSRFKTLVSVSIESFDNNPDQLNCQNGVVDLRTGRLEKHSHTQRFTYCIPVPYAKTAYTEWLNYLQGVVGGGQIVLDYLQKAVGYSLTGHTREEILFYLFGPTRSGKGTFAETIMALLPSPISTMVDFNSFTTKREGDVSNFDLAPLKPSRLIFASESNRHQSLNPAKVKQLTGGDQIRACFKHRDFFAYRPQFKVWMMSNYPVNGDPEDDALWGRVRVIEFPNSFLGKEDKSKKALLKTPDVMQGVLYWAVEGAIQWYALGAQGLTTPTEIDKVTREHRNDLDYVQQWLDECCDDNEGGWVANEHVMASYSEWCKSNNVQYPKGPKALAQSLQGKGYHPALIKKVDGKTKRGVGGLHVYPTAKEMKELMQE